MSQLANFITIASLVCGFISIIFSLEGHFTFAAWAIILSVIFDGLDGQVARKIKVNSEFGKELDSLVDVVSFGVAPSILGYTFVYQDFYFLATVALFIYLFCSVMRLAKYNITPKESVIDYFYGLPTTMAGGVLASFILVYRRYSERVPPPGTFLLLVLLLAYLMVSGVKYINLDGVEKVLGRYKFIIIWVLLVLMGTVAIFFYFTGVFLPEISIFMLFIIYLLFSPFMLKLLNT